MRRLRSIGLIRMRKGKTVGQTKGLGRFDLADFVALTDLGQRWVRRIREIEDEGHDDAEHVIPGRKRVYAFTIAGAAIGVVVALLVVFGMSSSSEVTEQVEKDARQKKIARHLEGLGAVEGPQAGQRGSAQPRAAAALADPGQGRRRPPASP